MMPCVFQEGASTRAQPGPCPTVHTILKLEGVTDASAGFRTEFRFKLSSEFFYNGQAGFGAATNV
jgi:hypothetical protein